MITIGSSIDGVGNGVCVHDGGDVEGKPKIINVCNPPLQGRYVHVKVKSNSFGFALCEIEVFGSEGK